MTTPPVTADLLNHLVAGSHAEGVTALAVQAVISRDDEHVLLLADPGLDVIDHTWQLPAGPVLPGQSLTDALDPVAASLGMSIHEVTGYLGHRDEHTSQQVVRTFRFAVTVTDPDAICRSAIIGHHWAHPDDLTDHTGRRPAEPPAPTPAVTEPQLSGALRGWARGTYPDEAAVELLIAHAAFLHRRDFTDRFVIPATGHDDDDDQAIARIDWSSAVFALNTGDLPCSRSEERILRLAASLSGGVPVNLHDTTTALDPRNTTLLSEAILHATGHQPSPQNH